MDPILKALLEKRRDDLIAKLREKLELPDTVTDEQLLADVKAAVEEIVAEEKDGDGDADPETAKSGQELTEQFSAIVDRAFEKAAYRKPGERKGASVGDEHSDKGPGIWPNGRYGRDVHPKDQFSYARAVRYIATGDEKYLEDVERKALATTPGASGGFLIFPDDPMSIQQEIDNAQQVIPWVRASGGQILDEDESWTEIPIPKEAGGHTLEWGLENTEAAGSDMSFGTDSLKPKDGVALAKLSEQLVFRGRPSAEQAVRSKIVRDFAVGLDLEYLRGDGTGGKPTGIENIAGVSTYTLVADAGNGAAFSDYDDVVGLLNVARQNNVRPVAMLVSAREEGSLQKIKDSQNRPIFIMPSDGSGGPGRVLGASVLVTNQIPTNLTKGTSTDTSKIFSGDARSVWIARSGLRLRASNEGAAFRARQIHIMGIIATDIQVSYPAEITITDGVRP